MSSSSLCVSCSMQFTLFKRKNRCPACKLAYCSQCFRKGESLPRRNIKQCLKCHALSSRPYVRSELMLLTVKELKAFLEQKNVSLTGCREKGDLVDVIINDQARPQVAPSHSSVSRQATNTPHTSTQAPSSPRQAQPSANTQHARQAHDFFGLGPEIQQFVENMFQVDDGNNQPHFPWTDRSEPRHYSNMETPPFTNFPSTQVERPSHTSLDSIKDESDIRKLSAKELKLLLDHNFVDYKGCIEKEELVQRALLLWKSKLQQQDSSSRTNESPEGGSENEVCKVCMDRIMDCVFLDCGHLVTCVDCGRKLRECPMCRQNIVRVVRVFKS